MPPRKQITKEQIIEKAYELVSIHGFHNLSARILASEMGCSTQPIYISFQNMNELKDCLAKKAIDAMMLYILAYKKENYAPVLSKILGYVQFASEEKYLYQLIISSKIMDLDNTKNEVMKSDELEQDMLIYAHGIIMMKIYGTLLVDWQEIKKMIIKVYEKLSV